MADPAKPSRRDLLKGAGVVAAASGAGAAQAQPPAAPARREALETLSATEADVLEAFCARLIPSDESGPGAREARAAHYIDRSLAGALSASREAYRAGLTALDARARSLKGQTFARLADADQDAVLMALEKEDPGFFGLVRGHTLQGTFGDPYYGGNAGFVGWDMIGYPGVRLAVTQPQQAMDPHLQKVRMSAYDFSMFDRSGARVAMANPAPVDHEHMASGMGDPQHDR
ncbi:MAG: gluconate 2-dehydrogenase subunit 3 family protein [Caulobacteraceae bacterium]